MSTYNNTSPCGVFGNTGCILFHKTNSCRTSDS